MSHTSLSALADERRRLPLSVAGVSIRTVGGGTDTATEDRFGGYAAIFNKRTAIGNPKTVGFYEEVSPGCFTKALQESDTRFLIDHNPYYVVARVSAGTLELAQDKTGLKTDSALDQALSYVNDLKANIHNRNITGMSFGFQVIKDAWSTEQIDTRDGGTAEVEVRRLIEVTLPEVSAVAFPAYEDTMAELNSIALALIHRGDPDAIERRARYRPELRELCGVVTRRPARDPEARKAIPAHSTATTTVPWSAMTNVDRIPAGASAAVLTSEYAWRDSAGDDTAKASFRYPHHLVATDGSVGAASTVACSAGIAALNGARGGSTIPAADRQGVWAHLAAHLKDAKMAPPPLKSGNAAEPPEETRDDEEPLEPVDVVTEPEDGEQRAKAPKERAVEDPADDKDPEDDPEDPDESDEDEDKEEDEEDEPVAHARQLAPNLADRMRALAKRYHLPAAPPKVAVTAGTP
jgi:HK97 family phage prohead protease